jgi:hypothetical protein
VEIEERLGFVLSEGVAQGVVVDGGEGRVVVVGRGRRRKIGRGALPGGAVESGAEAGISRIALRLCRGGFALCCSRAGESSVASGLLGALIKRGGGVAGRPWERRAASSSMGRGAVPGGALERRRRAEGDGAPAAAPGREERPGVEPRRLIP